MIQKLKYIFFDFSNAFKKDFIATFKKSVVFLVLGVMGLALSGINSTLSAIGGLGILLFGVIWAKGLATGLTSLVAIPRNFFFKFFTFIFVYAFCMLLGYIYFAWGCVKMIIIAVKTAKKNSDKEKEITK